MIIREHRARENLDAILRQSAFRRQRCRRARQALRELLSAQPLPADVTVTEAALGGVPTAEITVEGIEPRHVVLYFHGGVYVMGDAFLAADLASQVGRRTDPKVISVDSGSPPSTRIRQRLTTLLRPMKPSCDNGIAPCGHRLRRRVRRRRARRGHPGQRSRSRAALAGRGLRHVTVCRSHPGRDDDGNQARGRSADEPRRPPSPSHRLHARDTTRLLASSARYSPICPACLP